MRQREQLAELIESSDLEQSKFLAARHDTANWIAVGEKRSDGIPTGALDIENVFAQLTQRLFNQSDALGHKDSPMARDAPL